MIDLKKITLVAIDGSQNELSYDTCLRSLLFSKKECAFFDSKFICSDPDKVKNKNIKDIKIEKCESFSYGEEYNKFCLTELHHYIESEYMLLVHPDGFIINPNLWDDDFMQYDYIGAPWPKHTVLGTSRNFPEIYKDVLDSGVQYLVGNGGFTLRSKKMMEQVEKIYYNGNFKGVPEDQAICQGMRKDLEHKGFLFPSVEVASKFSCEEIRIDGMILNPDQSFGFHGKHHHPRFLELLKEISL